jgi:hypothetical protein
VPEMIPLLVPSTSPPGSCPEESEKVKGDAPPPTASGTLYSIPTWAGLKVPLKVNGMAVIVIAAVAALVGSALLVAVTVALEFALTLGA